jgi:putative membrane protein insertion efficiency factor
MGKGRATVQKILIAVIRVYRYLLSPWLGQSCRFYPSCSHYALESIETHGSLRGSWLALRRLLRCHPWRAGGYDPVPPAGHSHPHSGHSHHHG